MLFSQFVFKHLFLVFSWLFFWWFLLITFFLRCIMSAFLFRFLIQRFLARSISIWSVIRISIGLRSIGHQSVGRHLHCPFSILFNQLISILFKPQKLVISSLHGLVLGGQTRVKSLFLILILLLKGGLYFFQFSKQIRVHIGFELVVQMQIKLLQVLLLFY